MKFPIGARVRVKTTCSKPLAGYSGVISSYHDAHVFILAFEGLEAGRKSYYGFKENEIEWINGLERILAEIE